MSDGVSAISREGGHAGAQFSVASPYTSSGMWSCWCRLGKAMDIETPVSSGGVVDYLVGPVHCPLLAERDAVRSGVLDMLLCGPPCLESNKRLAEL